eukprot:10605777-Lingulodinium_polyedra.AAC.1
MRWASVAQLGVEHARVQLFPADALAFGGRQSAAAMHGRPAEDAEPGPCRRHPMLVLHGGAL